MNKALSFIRLDFITVKPYITIKMLAIIIAAPLLITISTGISSITIGFFVTFAAMYISYPFAICEKNSMDALYPTLSLTRETVVLGRYLFTLTIDICAALLGFAFISAASFVLGNPFDAAESILVMLVAFAAVSVIEAVQLPVYFKLGYDKAKIIAYLPFVGFFLAVMAINSFFSGGSNLAIEIIQRMDWIVQNPYVAVVISIVIWFGIMIISYQKSVSYYKKRDF